MISYEEAFKDGYEFARIDLVEKISELDGSNIDSWTINHLVELIQANQV
jgi:hypothetical protein